MVQCAIQVGPHIVNEITVMPNPKQHLSGAVLSTDITKRKAEVF